MWRTASARPAPQSAELTAHHKTRVLCGNADTGLYWYKGVNETALLELYAWASTSGLPVGNWKLADGERGPTQEGCLGKQMMMLL